MVLPAEFQIAVDSPDPKVDGLGTVGLQEIEFVLFQVFLGEFWVEREEKFPAVVVGFDRVGGEFSLGEICFK